MNKIKFIKSFVLLSLVLLFIGFIQAQPAHAISGNAAYEELMSTTTAEEMRTVLLTLADERIEELGAMTPSQLNNVRNHVDSIDILTENDITIKEEIHETLDLLDSIVQGNSEVSAYASGINSNSAYMYASTDLLNRISNKSGNNKIEYREETDTIRITALSNHGDPSVEINVEGLVGTDSEWANEFGYLVISYRASKSSQTQLYFLYNDSQGGEETDYHPCTQLTFNTIGVDPNTEAKYNPDISGEKNFHTTTGENELDLNNIKSNPNNDNTKGHGWGHAISCKKIRFDYFATVEVGDWFEIDAIAFCKKDNSYTGTLRVYPDNLKKDYFAWERENVRNNNGYFYASQNLLYLFGDAHKVDASYVSDIENSGISGIKLKMVNTQCANLLTGQKLHQIKSTTGNLLYDCTWFDNKIPPGIFDPTIVFTMPNGIRNTKKYMILTYMTPNDPYSEIIYEGINPLNGKAIQKTFEERGKEIPVGVYPTTNDSTRHEDYRREFPINEEGVWYTRYIDLSDMKQQEVMTDVRIDPFNLAYVQEETILYIKSIIFTEDLDKVKDELSNEFPYTYEVNYNSNLPAGINESLLKNMPKTESIVHGNNKLTTYTFTLPSTNPSLDNYTFIGWSKTANGEEIIKDRSVKLIGVVNGTVEITLYAIWALQATTLHYTVETPQGVTSEYGSLSVKDELVGITEERPNGTILTLNIGFRLEGWYDSGGNKISTDLVFKPIKGTNDWTETTFTAKIVYESIVFSLSIKEGKYYNSITNNITSINILQNSSFTIELLMNNYYPNVHEDITILNFDKSLPKDTKLLLIDFSNPNQINYYIYQTLGTENGLKLSNFFSIKDNTKKYTDDKKAEQMTKKFLIVGEFAKTNSETGTYNVGFENYPVQNLLDNTKLTINVGTKRTTSIVDNSASNLSMNEKLNISYEFTTSTGTGIDTLYLERHYALYVTLKNSKLENIVYPEGAYIEYNGINYYPTSDNMKIIIPIGALTSSTLNLTLNTPYDKLEESNYELNVTTYVSATSDANNPRGGEQVGELITKFKVGYVNKAINISRPNNNETQIFTKVEAEAGINFAIQTLNINKEELIITLEKLEGTSWISVNDVFIENIDFSTVTDTFLVKLNSEKITGMTTYRLVVKTADNLVQDEIIIIITE